MRPACRALCILLAAAIAGCAGQSGEPQRPGAELAAIRSLPPPADVDPQLWSRLTAALADVLASQPRRASGAASGPGSEVRDFYFTETLGGLSMRWSYRNQGDYDLNGEANISDLVQIAAHFGARSTEPNWELHQHADGDGNGEVNIADVTPLGSNFGGRVVGYVVQNGGLAQFGDIAFVPFDGGDVLSGELPQLSYLADDPQLMTRYRVTPTATAVPQYEFGPPSNDIGWVGNNPTQRWPMAGRDAERRGQSPLQGPAALGQVWTTELTGECFSFSGFVADRAGVSYVASYSELDDDIEAALGHISAVASDGTLRWVYTHSAAIIEHPVILADSTVVFKDILEQVVALSPDGKLRWRQQLSSAGIYADQPLLIGGDGMLFALDDTPALRKITPSGDLEWTVPLPQHVNSNGIPIGALDDVLLLLGTEVRAFAQFDGAPAGSVVLAQPPTGALLFNGSDYAFAQQDQPSGIEGIPFDVGGQLLYSAGHLAVPTAPIFTAAGELVVAEAVASANPEADPTGRLVGLDAQLSEAWDRPLAAAPIGAMCSDADGRIYCCVRRTPQESGAVCIGSTHELEWFLPIPGFGYGALIAAPELAVFLHAVDGRLRLTGVSD